MDKNPTAPRALGFSTRLYQMLLIIYPAEFRRAYGGPMRQVFRDCCRQALRESGSTGLLALWGRTILDAVRTALEEHSRRGVDMNREKFIKLSGWALMLGGLSLVLGMAASSRPEYYPNNARSLFIDRYANAADTPLYTIGFLLLSTGFTGLLLRYGLRTGVLGRFWLVLGALTGIVAAVGAVGLSNFDGEPWWSLFFLGTLAQFLALAFFGLASLSQRALPRWKLLPVLTGLWLPLLAAASLIIEQLNGGFVEMPPAAVLVVMLLTLGGLFGLGYLLQSDTQAVGTSAAAS